MDDKPKTTPDRSETGDDANAAAAPVCPMCGGELIDIRSKLICSRCHTIVETCCEGGRG